MRAEASDPAAMQRLSALGRELRDAQTGLVRTELRSLADQRRQLIADLMDRAKAHAAAAGIRLTPTVLSEVEATLQAALVDLAGALTVRNGRLVRPLSHSGFGPRPRSALQLGSTELRPVEVPTEAAAAEIEIPAVEDELQARRQQRAVGGRWTVERVEATERAAVEAHDAPAAPDGGQEQLHELRRAEEHLAAAEAAHWQSEFDLADAEAAVEAADDAVSSLDTKRIEARRDRVTAQRHLAEAQSRQRDAVNVLAEARRRLDAAKHVSDRDE